MSAEPITVMQMAIPESKVCRECDSEKLAAEFFTSKDGGGRLYLSAACRSCTAVRTQRWREANREQAREQVRGYYERHRDDPERRASRRGVQRKHFLKKRYAITVEQYNAMLDAQGGVCAICHDPETMVMKGTIANLAVDHDPETMRVRGLLCFDCNTGIGKLDHDEDRLRAAIEYLTKEI